MWKGAAETLKAKPIPIRRTPRTSRLLPVSLPEAAAMLLSTVLPVAP